MDQSFEDEAVRCRENTADAWLSLPFGGLGAMVPCSPAMAGWLETADHLAKSHGDDWGMVEYCFTIDEDRMGIFFFNSDKHHCNGISSGQMMINGYKW